VVIGAIARGRIREDARQFVDMFRSPRGALIAVTIVYAFASVLWAPDISYATEQALRTVRTVASAAMHGARLCAIHNMQMRRWPALGANPWDCIQPGADDLADGMAARRASLRTQ